MTKKLLEESAVRKFMKIAGLQPLTESFIKDNLEENERGATFGRADEDARLENLQEKDKLKEVEGLKEDSTKVQEESKDAQLEEKKDLVGKPKKVAGSHADQKLKPAKASTKNMVKENDEVDLVPADAPPVDDLPHAEPDGDEVVGAAGGLDVSSLVRAIAAAIEAETGVRVDVEGAEAGAEELSGDETALDNDAATPTEDVAGGGEEVKEPPLDEEVAAMAGYKGEDQSVKHLANLSESVKKQIVEEVAKRVVEKLSVKKVKK